MSRIYGVHRFAPYFDPLPVLSSSNGPLVYNEDRSVVLAADAHIDNGAALTRELLGQGHRILSPASVDVIVHLYEEYGADCVKRLRGDFAFVLWDSKKRILLLARDRLGIKPLYYSLQDGFVVFASSLGQIFSCPGVKKELCRNILPLYFSFMALPAPYTFFKGVRKMAPATILQFDADGRTSETEYWNLLKDAPREDCRRECDCVDGLIGALDGAVHAQSGTGRAAGSFLSGGTDSSLITALAAKHNGSLSTFTTGFSGDERSHEFPFARKVAGLLATQHHESTISMADLTEGSLRRLLALQEEPTLRPGCISYYHLSGAARQAGADYVFVGEGGDELFGYPLWKKLLSLKPGLDAFSRCPSFLQRPVMEFFHKKDPAGMAYETLRRSRAQQSLFWGSFNLFYPGDIGALLAGTHGARDGDVQPYEVIRPLVQDFERSAYRDDYSAFLTHVDLRVKMPETFLRWFDRMSGAHGLNVRFPYLDHVFVEYVLGRCTGFNQKKGPVKYLLKKAAERLVPRECIYRKKQGWGMGVTASYFSLFKDFSGVRKTIDGFNQRYGYFNGEYIDRLFLGTAAPRQRAKIWQLYIFVLWLEGWMDL
ncbi:MAG: asparagine synthase (glutamine-hydrolyzing) [Candidatus Omnitrophica bacterium]|nr:asparagine synthase (glutamine-hydrolyzing) [Candidatus Omnitrophota bacterium]